MFGRISQVTERLDRGLQFKNISNGIVADFTYFLHDWENNKSEFMSILLVSAA